MKIRAPRRILLFNVNWLGDVLFSTAAVRNLRQNFPESYIACVIPPRCLPVLEGNPHLDRIILFDEKKEFRGLIGMLRFAGLLRRERFDTVFLLHRSFSRALITLMAGIGQRIGYATAKRWFLLTRRGPAPSVTSVHRIDYYLGVLKIAGLEIRDRSTELVLGTDDVSAADLFLKSHLPQAGSRRFLIGINPGGNWGPKRWSVDSFAELAGRCCKELGATVIVTGASADAPLAEAIGRRAPVISAAGSLNLRQFAALCRRLDIFVSADSGPLHIANAAGCPRIIALFGPTDPLLTGPHPRERVTLLQKRTSCRVPCYVVDCPDNRCMQAITVDDVIAAIKPYVQRT